MRMLTSILAVLVATLLVSPVHPQEAAAPARHDQADDSAKTVEKLRKERIAVLKSLTDAVDDLYKISRVSFDEVLEARQLLIDAEVEASKTEAERVELYKNLIVVLHEYESLADVQHKAARATVANILKAKAKRLDAEIHLEQAKMKIAQAAR